MSGWIERRPSGFLVCWRGADGSRLSKSYPTKGEAAEALRAFRASQPPRRRRRAGGGPQPADSMTIAALGQLWLTAKRAAGKAATADEALRRALAAAAALGWTRPQDANADQVHAHLAEREGAGRRDLAYLRGILRWGADHRGQPLDRAADAALRPGAGEEGQHELLTEEQWAAIRARAYELGHGLLVDCLATYGWRPITAARLTCADVRADGSVVLAVKKRGLWTHALFPLHAARLRELAAGRPAAERLFLSATGNPWPINNGKAARMTSWYAQQLKHLAPECGSIYALKRFAISRMDAGKPPWTRPLTISQIQRFTGHKVPGQVLRYLRTNQEETLAAMGAGGGQ